MGCARALVGGAMRCVRTLVWALRWDVRERLWGLCDGMCESACGGVRQDVCFLGLEKRNCDLNHKNLRIDLVQIKKFRSGP